MEGEMGIDLIEVVIEQVESGEEDVDISGETTSMRSSDRSDSEGDELALGPSSNDGDEGGDSGHDVDMP